MIRRADYILHRALVKPLLTLYLRRDRTVSFDGFRLTVRKGVFHPLLFFSTKFLYGHLKSMDLEGKRFLEIGCGSGLISLLAHRKGAKVMCVDIDPRAVQNTSINFEKNFGPRHGAVILQSDILDNVHGQLFDVIAVNPPYYFKRVNHPDQQAWYCGEEGEYFRKLFSQLSTRSPAKVLMVLEENCDIARIGKMAGEYHLRLDEVDAKRFRWEVSYIFSVRRA